MDLVRLIQHPELMNKETLYELRSLVALYPYYQTARLLMLQNMYLMHDSAFDDELHRAALYVSDRSLLFELVEGAHYKIKTAQELADEKSASSAAQRDNDSTGNRTISLIDSYLETAQPYNDNEAQTNSSRCRNRLRGISAKTRERRRREYQQRKSATEGAGTYRRLHQQRRWQDTTARQAHIQTRNKQRGQYVKRQRRRVFHRDFGQNLYKTRQIFKGT